MNIEKLIEQLRTESLYADKASLEIMDLCMEAATALSTLQAKNEEMQKIRRMGTNKIKEKRIALGLKQSECAEKAQIAQPNWARLENGSRDIKNISLETAIKIADVLKIKDIRELI